MFDKYRFCKQASKRKRATSRATTMRERGKQGIDKEYIFRQTMCNEWIHRTYKAHATTATATADSGTQLKGINNTQLMVEEKKEYYKKKRQSPQTWQFLKECQNSVLHWCLRRAHNAQEKRKRKRKKKTYFIIELYLMPPRIRRISSMPRNCRSFVLSLPIFRLIFFFISLCWHLTIKYILFGDCKDCCR